MENINWIDVILGGSVIISLLIGFSRGLIKEILSILAWIIALWLAFHFADNFSHQFIRQFLQDETISYVAAFGIIFLVGLFALGILNMSIAAALNFINKSALNRLFGGVFGLVRGVIIAALIVLVANIIPVIKDSNMWASSKFAPIFQGIADKGIENIPLDLRQKIDEINLSSLYGTQSEEGIDGKNTAPSAITLSDIADSNNLIIVPNPNMVQEETTDIQLESFTPSVSNEQGAAQLNESEYVVNQAEDATTAIRRAVAPPASSNSITNGETTIQLESTPGL